MTNYIDEIIRILADLDEHYLKLKLLFSQKYKHISRGDISNLAKNISDTQDVISKINELESKRQTITLNIALKNNLNSNDMNVSLLSSMFPNKSKTIKNLSQNIQDTISEIKVADNRSNRLIKNSLDQIRWFLVALGQESLSLSPHSFFDQKI